MKNNDINISNINIELNHGEYNNKNEKNINMIKTDINIMIKLMIKNQKQQIVKMK